MARILFDCYRALLWAALFGLAAFSLSAFLARVSQPFEIFSNFRLQFAAAALGLLVLSLPLRSWRAVTVCAALTLLNGATVLAPLGRHAPVAETPQGATRLLWANLQGNPAALDAAAALTRTEHADIVALGELPPEGASAVRQAFADFACLPSPRQPYRTFYTMIIARAPCTQFEIAVPPSVIAVASIDRLSVVAVHARPPKNNQHTADRDAAIAAAIAAARGGVLLGDFNAAPWSPGLIDIGRGEFRRAHCGAPFQPTWRSAHPLFGLTIDHVFVAQGFTIAGCRRGPAIGSDHWPLIVDIVRVGG
jgi:endonuclease/exonuclease/phosphatase (EEP) superfamily protein YafD